MAKSLHRHLTDAAGLVASLRLTSAAAYSVRIDADGITIQMEPIALARVSRQLQVPRSKVQISEHDYQGRVSIHIDFSARGARWTAVIFADRLQEFYAAMGVEPALKQLTLSPLALESIPGGSCRALTVH